MSFMAKEKLNVKATKILKAVLGVFVVLSIALTLLFVALESHHDCEGEACPVCACLEECVDNIKGFSNSLPILSAVLAAFTAVVLCSLAVSEGLVYKTPITVKVRMNN